MLSKLLSLYSFSLFELTFPSFEFVCVFFWQSPVSGTFSADQRGVYESVLSAQRAVMEAVRPGVHWSHCHKLAERAILQGLQGLGVLLADVSLEELEAADIGAVFFPHGLGHLIGCDTHDVGGYYLIFYFMCLIFCGLYLIFFSTYTLSVVIVYTLL